MREKAVKVYNGHHLYRSLKGTTFEYYPVIQFDDVIQTVYAVPIFNIGS